MDIFESLRQAYKDSSKAFPPNGVELFGAFVGFLLLSLRLVIWVLEEYFVFGIQLLFCLVSTSSDCRACSLGLGSSRLRVLGSGFRVLR